MNRLIWLGGALPLLMSVASVSAQPPRTPDTGAMFRFGDTNRDGAINKEEFTRMLTRSPRFKDNPQFIEAIFKRLDADSDGSLSLQEYAKVARPQGSPRPAAPKPKAEPEVEKPKAAYPPTPSSDGVVISPKEWENAELKPLTSVELDRLMLKALKTAEAEPAPKISDEEFIRRVSLDLTGELPRASEIVTFVRDRSLEKRSKLIDNLLESPEFAAYQARFWRDVMLSRATDERIFVKLPREVALERWLREQFSENTSWAEITRQILTANGTLTLTDLNTSDGPSGFLLSHQREDGPIERTNDTARVFLGINVQCAQCHDHPEDIWKREQFHQMAAYFGRTQEYIRNRAARDERPDFQASIGERRFGEYGMPDQENPDRKTTIQPVFFLDGKQPGSRLSDMARRQSLSDSITDPTNYYFHAAFVNRIWDQLMGRPFTVLVDNMGPLQEATYPEVLNALAVHFRTTDSDIRSLYQVILNSDTYQRDFRLDEDFAGKMPAQVSADGLWGSLSKALGLSTFSRGSSRFGGGFPGGRGGNIRQTFIELFRFDPSKPTEEVEMTVPQALMLMNGQAITDALKADGRTPLASILRDYPNDADAAKALYLQVLGRRPTNDELAMCVDHVCGFDNRGKAYEDIAWVLVNSTEFRLKR